jgi:DNA-binding CsgD family transcriptional regulator
MSPTSRFQSAVVKSAADVESWHPDLEILVRDDLAFICFDEESSAVHISRRATEHLAKHESADATFEALRRAAGGVLEVHLSHPESLQSRILARITEPGNGGTWSVHVIRTRHDWPIAVAVSDAARALQERMQKRERLTKRELEVAALVAEGKPTKNVAAALSISIHTARRHTEQVFRKLGVHSRVEMTRVVLRGGDVALPFLRERATWQVGATL